MVHLIYPLIGVQFPTVLSGSFCLLFPVCKKLKQMEYMLVGSLTNPFEPRQEISNNVVCATSKASYQPVHMHSLIRAFASRLYIL